MKLIELYTGTTPIARFNRVPPLSQLQAVIRRWAEVQNKKFELHLDMVNACIRCGGCEFKLRTVVLTCVDKEL